MGKSKILQKSLSKVSSTSSLNNLFRDPRDNSPSICELEQTLNVSLDAISNPNRKEKVQKIIDQY